MTVHNTLSELGFSLVGSTAAGGHYRHHRANISAVLSGDRRPAVTAGGVLFSGVRTVGDVRELLRLLGVTVPGDGRTVPADDDERERMQEQEVKWRGWDGLPLRFDYTKGAKTTPPTA